MFVRWYFYNKTSVIQLAPSSDGVVVNTSATSNQPVIETETHVEHSDLAIPNAIYSISLE